MADPVDTPAFRYREMRAALKRVAAATATPSPSVPTGEGEGDADAKKGDNSVEDGDVTAEILLDHYSRKGLLSDATMERFLKACNYDVTAACNGLISHLFWRQEFKVDTILEGSFSFWCRMCLLFYLKP